jgi:PAS domain S-box-containing protein
VGIVDDSSRQDDGRRFRALIENGADGVALIDAERRILYANPALERLFDIPRARLIGMTAHDCFHASDRPLARDALIELAKQPGA